MLGFQYVVAKSRELSSVLDRELSSISHRSSAFRTASEPSSVETEASNDASVASNASPTSRNEGHTFLQLYHERVAQTVSNHANLLRSGQELDAALSATRARLQDQAASEQFLLQHCHLVSTVRNELVQVRKLVLQVAQEVNDVENMLLRRWEEKAAQQNATFALQQQEELERFEESLVDESEGRKREVVAQRREAWKQVVENDLRTYQTVVRNQMDAKGGVVRHEKEDETLEQVDLVVTADPEQIKAFYESSEEEEEEEKEKEEEEEEEEEKED